MKNAKVYLFHAFWMHYGSKSKWSACRKAMAFVIYHTRGYPTLVRNLSKIRCCMLYSYFILCCFSR
jgi:hypothetical protein